MDKMISNSMSLRGYDLYEWFRRNKSKLKSLVVAITMLLTFIATTYLPLWINGGLALLIGTLSQLTLDFLDFWLSDVEL